MGFCGGVLVGGEGVSTGVGGVAGDGVLDLLGEDFRLFHLNKYIGLIRIGSWNVL